MGIKIAIETLPPLFMSGSRFVIAGALLFGALRMQGQPVPAAKHWFNGFVVGVLLIGFGNGVLTWAGADDAFWPCLVIDRHYSHVDYSAGRCSSGRMFSGCFERAGDCAWFFRDFTACWKPV